MDAKSAAEARRARILAGGKDRIRLAKGEAPDSTDGEATNNDNSNPPSEEKAPRRSSIAKRKEARARKEAVPDIMLPPPGSRSWPMHKDDKYDFRNKSFEFEDWFDDWKYR